VAEHILDARGLKCPLPILKADRALKDLASGETLRVLTTDPGSVEDFKDFCRASRNEMVESQQEGGTYTLLIKRVA
jgi:tRNA 2-thiouridine synthesizing protein A